MGIASLSPKDIGRFVEVTGSAKQARVKDGNFFVEICQDEDCVSAVAFEPVARKISPDPRGIAAGDILTIKGIVQESQGLEIIISRPEWVER